MGETMNGRLLQVEEMRSRKMTYKAIGLELGVSVSRAQQLTKEIVRRRERGQWCEILVMVDETTNPAHTRVLLSAFRAGFRTLAAIQTADDRTILAAGGVGKVGLRLLRQITGPHLNYERTA